MSAQKVIKFYERLAYTLFQEGLTEVLTRLLVESHNEVKNEISLDLDIEDLKKVFEARDVETPEGNKDQEILEDFVECAFADMAKQWRSPIVRRVFATLLDQAGLSNYHNDVFVKVANIRHLEDDEDGAAVITLVTDKNNVLLNHILGNKQADRVHCR